MSTLAEIEDAVQKLPPDELRRLLAFVSDRIDEPPAAVVDDPLAALAGNYASGFSNTAARAKDILYGKDE